MPIFFGTPSSMCRSQEFRSQLRAPMTVSTATRSKISVLDGDWERSSTCRWMPRTTSLWPSRNRTQPRTRQPSTVTTRQPKNQRADLNGNTTTYSYCPRNWLQTNAVQVRWHGPGEEDYRQTGNITTRYGTAAASDGKTAIRTARNAQRIGCFLYRACSNMQLGGCV